MLLLIPPLAQAAAGVALLVAGVAVHSVILDVIGAAGIAIVGARWFRKRRGR
jgi:hypothetical protein